MIIFVLAPLIFALIVGLPVGLALWLVRRSEKRKASMRGFDISPGAPKRNRDRH
jgi:hypothetical protein